MMNARTRWSLLAVPVLTALGCSSAVPLPSQGAVSLNIQSVAANGMSCPFTAKTYLIGNPAPAPGNAGDNPVIDGTGSSTVSCSVLGSGPYTFSGSLSAVSTESQPITVTLTGGTVDASTGSGTVNVSVFTPDLATTYNNGSTPCTATVLTNPPQIKPGNPGSILVTFTCPTIASPPSGLCGIGRSTILFENCNGD